MRTIELKVYEFEELSEQAKQKAIDILRERAARQACDQDWDDASESARKLEEIAHVKTNIEYSSQGFYTRWYWNTNPDYELTDEEAFNKFKEEFMEHLTGDKWSDDMLYDIVTKAHFDDNHSYEWNIASILLSFCKEVEEDTLDYHEDDYVSEWIIGNEIFFYEDGRIYNEYA